MSEASETLIEQARYCASRPRRNRDDLVAMASQAAHLLPRLADRIAVLERPTKGEIEALVNEAGNRCFCSDYPLDMREDARPCVVCRLADTLVAVSRDLGDARRALARYDAEPHGSGGDLAPP